MTTKQQLERWVEGESLHNDERDECCPDFSCCEPGLLASEEERKTFAAAYYDGNEEVTNGMLMMFLGKMVSDSGSPAHVAGFEYI